MFSLTPGVGRGSQGRPAAWTPFPGLQTQGGTQTPHSFPVSGPPRSSRVGLNGAPFPPRLPSPYKHGPGEILSSAHPLLLLPAFTLTVPLGGAQPQDTACASSPGSLCPTCGPGMLPGGGDRQAGGGVQCQGQLEGLGTFSLVGPGQLA